MSTIRYIKNFIRDPKVASITPTSRFTIGKVCKHIDFDKDIKIVEYGPADGVFTKILLSRMTPGSEIIAIEANKNFAKALRTIDDKRLHVENCSAETVDEVAQCMSWDSADYVISGIPFSFIPYDIKNGIVKKTAGLLNNEGAFLVYQTSSHMKPFLSRHFSDVSIEMEFLNVPPMCIMKAQKQKSG